MIDEITLDSESSRTPKPQAFRPFARHLDRGFLPYPGLRPFERREARIFFGRRRYINELLDLLAQSHFVAVIGPSGCGKSSLIRAGVLAELESGLLEQAGARWCTATMRPGSSPMWSLAETLLGVVKPDAKAEPEEILSIRSVLGAGPAGIWNLLQKYQLPEGRSLLLLVDQFEELFRYDIVGGEREANDFVALLLDVFLDPPESVYIVITMRTDYLGDCTRFMGLPEAMNKNHYLVPRLNKEELRQAIERPALIAGGEVELALTERILRGMGSDPDHLPLMQHTLMWMWIRAQAKTKAAVQSQETAPAPGGELPVLLTLADYKEIGDLFKALSNHANEVFDSLDEEQQGIAEVMFRRLTERDEGQREIRHPTKCSDILQVAGMSLDDLRPVVECFSHPHCSFIVLDRKELTDETVLDIGHESLIRQWDKLKEWTDQEAQSARIFREMVEHADRYAKGEQGPLDELRLKIYERCWKSEQKTYGWKEPYPTPLWAKRYQKDEGDFDAATHYYEASKKNIKEKSRQKFFMGVIGIIAILSVVGWAVTWLGTERLEEARLSEKHGLMLQHSAKLAAEMVQTESYTRESYTRLRREDLERIFESSQFDSDSKLAERAENVRGLFRAFVDLYIGFPVSQESKKDKFPIPFQALDLAYSRDGKFTAAIDKNGQVVLLDERGTLLTPREKPWSAHKPSPLQLREHKFNHLMTRVQFVQKENEYGTWLATAGGDRKIRVWRLAAGDPASGWSLSGQAEKEIPLSEDVRAVAFSRDGLKAASIHSEKLGLIIKLWNLLEKRQEKDFVLGFSGFNPSVEGIAGIAFGGPENSVIAIAFGNGSNGSIYVWDTQAKQSRDQRSNQLRPKLLIYTQVPQALDISLKGDKLATSVGQDVHIWDLKDDKPKKISLLKHSRPVTALKFVGDDYLLSGGERGEMRLWDLKLRDFSKVLIGHEVPIAAFALSGVERIASVDSQGTLHQWDIIEKTDPHVRVVDLTRVPIATAISPKDGRIAIGFKDGTVDLCRETGENLEWLCSKAAEAPNGTLGEITGLAFSRDGARMAAATRDGSVMVWNTEDWEQQPPLIKDINSPGQKNGGIDGIAYSAERDRLAIASTDGGVLLWSITKNKIQALDHGGGERRPRFYSVAFSHDGKRVVASADDGKIRVWEVDTQKLTISRKLYKGLPVVWATFSPNGQVIASVVVPPSSGGPNGNQLIATAADQAGRRGHIGVQLIKVDGEPYSKNKSTPFPWEERWFKSVAFTPTGQQIVTIDVAGTVSIFDIEFGSLFDFRAEIFAGHPGSQDPLNFDFRCVEGGKDMDGCWISVPIPDSKQVLVYYLGRPFSKHATKSFQNSERH